MRSCNNAPLTGIIYLQQVTDTHSPAHLVGNMYKALCGDGPMTRIILVTTMWHEVVERAGERHHEELSRTWHTLTRSESSVHRLQGNVADRANHSTLRQNAWELLLPLIEEHNKRDSLLLKQELAVLQTELCKTDDGRKLWETLNEFFETCLQTQAKLSQLEFTRRFEKELNRDEEQLKTVMKCLNRFRGGSGDGSLILSQLISLMASKQNHWE